VKALELVTRIKTVNEQELDRLINKVRTMKAQTDELKRGLNEQAEAAKKAAAEGKKAGDEGEKSGKKQEESQRRVKKATDDAASSTRELASNLKNIITNPLQAAGDAAESFVLRFGKIGLVGTAIGATAGVVYSLAKSFEELAEKQSNAAGVLGIDIKTYGQLTKAIEFTGVESSALLGIMKGLTQALSDNSEEGKRAKAALASIGVSGQDAYGAIRPLDKILLDIADALGKIDNPAQRADASIKILGRSGLSLLPALNENLRKSVTGLNDLNVGIDAAAAADAQRFGDKIDHLSTRLENLAKKAKEASVSLLNVLLPDAPAQRDAKERQDAADQLNAALYFSAQREGRKLSLSPNELRAASIEGKSGPFAPGTPNRGAMRTSGLSSAQLEAQVRDRARAVIKELTAAKDDQGKIAEAQKELEAAVEKNDISEVKAIQARISRLQANVKEASRAEKLKAEADRARERLRQFNRGLTSFLDASKERQLAARQDLANASEAADAAVLENRLGAPAEFGLRIPALTSYDDLIANAQQRAQQAIGRAGFGAKPGDEERTINEQLRLRLEHLKEEYSLRERQVALITDVNEQERARIALGERYNREVLDAQYQREQEIADLRRKSLEETREAAGRVWDAFRSGGRGGLRDLVTGQLRVFERTVFQNLAVEVQGGLGALNLPKAKDGSFLGRTLQNTPFAPDKAANTQLTAANIQLAAAKTMATAISGQSVGSFGGGSPLQIAQQAAAAAGIPGAVFNSTTPSSGGGQLVIPPYNPSGARDILGNPLGTVPGVNAPGASRLSGTARGVGIAAAGIAGGIGVYSGIQEGGLSGGLTALGSAAGSAAAILPLLSTSLAAAGPIGAGVAIGAMLIKSFLPDRTAERREAIQSLVDSNRMAPPQGRTYQSTVEGMDYDYGYRGDVRVIQPINVTIPVNAIDSRSFVDHYEGICDAVKKGMQEGHGLTEEMR
jgi:hypothetical protein